MSSAYGQVANRQTRRTVNPFFLRQWARHPPCPPFYIGSWRNWERNSLARKRLWVQVPSALPPRIARQLVSILRCKSGASRGTGDITTPNIERWRIAPSQFRRGRPLLVNKAHPKPASGIVRRYTNQPSKILKFAGITERCETRRDIHAMGGNVAGRVSPRHRRQMEKRYTGVITAGVQVSTQTRWKRKREKSQPKSSYRQSSRVSTCTCLILFPNDRKTGSRHLTVNEGNSRPSWNSMVHYPNWQRETAQTRSSFGSNPK